MDDLVEFDTLFEETLLSPDQATVFEKCVEIMQSQPASIVVIHMECFFVPYTKKANLDFVNFFNKLVDLQLRVYLLSWREEQEEDDTLARLGIDAGENTVMFYRDPGVRHKKGMGWYSDVAEYNQTRVLNSAGQPKNDPGKNIVMHIGQFWIDVFPYTAPETALCSASTDTNIIFKHKDTEVYSVRLRSSTF